MKQKTTWALLSLLVLLVGSCIAGCQNKEAPPERAATPQPAPPETAVKPQPAPTPPPPPPPPETSFGKLVKVERAAKTPVEAMTLNGTRRSETKASKGRTFLILAFEGKSCSASGVVKMESIGAEGLVARTDERSWLMDEAGKKISPGIPASSRAKCQIAFEVPAEVKGLVWHDGKKKSYKLEPEIAEVSEPAGTAPPAKKP